jgi:uncharacterized repeat protein (TIGR01451 family)
MVSDVDNEICPLVTPNFTVSKECSPKGPGQITVPDPITWTITLQNTGDADLIVTCNDPVAGISDVSVSLPAGPGTVTLPGGPYTRPTTAGDIPAITNTVTCIGVLDPQQFPHLVGINEIERDATDTCPVIGTPVCEVDKSVNPTISKVGDTVTYSLGPICNTGNVPLTLVSCNDTVTGNCDALIDHCFPLAAGDCCDAPGTPFGTKDYTIMAGDSDPLPNTITVTCSGAGQTAVCEDTAEVDLIEPNFTVSKECSPKGPGLIAVPDPITWTITLENTGNANLEVTCNDPVADIVNEVVSLPAGATETITRSRPTTDGDIPEIENTVVCVGRLSDPDHAHLADANEIQRDATDTCPVIGDPVCSMNKSVFPETSKVGDTVTYTLGPLCNIGTVTLTSLASCNDTVTGDCLADFAPFFPLAVGDCTPTVQKPYTIQAGDPDPLPNTVTTTCDSAAGQATCGDDAVVDLVHPSCEITKECTPELLVIGEDITWDVEVCNTGDVSLDVEVNDPDAMISQTVTLAPGTCETITESRPVTPEDCPAGITNTATANWSIAGDLGTVLQNSGPCDPEGCRMTGGHNTMVTKKEQGEPQYDDIDTGTKYTTGGQIGAPNEAGCADAPAKGKCVEGVCSGGWNAGLECVDNDDCPNQGGRNSGRPWGNWQHNHHSGPDDGFILGGSFSFHSGTAAAPDEAFIKSIICADPGWCVQARPAPNKQIFWEGTGVFHNKKNQRGGDVDPDMAIFSNCDEQPIVYNKREKGTIHYYRAHVGDFGEPAGRHQKPLDRDVCPWFNETGVSINNCALADGFDPLIPAPVNDKFTEAHPLCTAQDCVECPDWYEIEISCDEKMPGEDGYKVAYKVAHHIRQGNFQIHPPVGDSCNPDEELDGVVPGTLELTPWTE